MVKKALLDATELPTEPNCTITFSIIIIIIIPVSSSSKKIVTTFD